MKLLAHLRDTVTGYSRVYEDEFSLDDLGVADFLWTEGNFACDCNRVTLLYGPDSPVAAEVTCATERIALDKLIVADTGEDLLASPPRI